MVEGWRSDAEGGPPSCLLVTCADAGSILVTWRGLPIVKLHLGEISPRGDEIFRLAPFQTLINLPLEDLYGTTYGPRPITNDDAVAQQWTLIWLAYTRCILWLILGVERLHHGGTIIVIRGADGRRALDIGDLRIKYAVEDWGLWFMLEEYCMWQRETDAWMNANTSGSTYKSSLLTHAGDAINLRDAVGRTLSDFTTFVAGLSAVDGAIVLTDRLKLVGFGAEIRCGDPIEHIDVVRRWPDDIVEKQPVESYGTRHRSAFRFCSKFDQAAVFVVSQDGGVRAVRKWGSRVLFWPNAKPGLEV